MEVQLYSGQPEEMAGSVVYQILMEHEKMLLLKGDDGFYCYLYQDKYRPSANSNLNPYDMLD
jgi:hypothetical protein